MPIKNTIAWRTVHPSGIGLGLFKYASNFFNC